MAKIKLTPERSGYVAEQGSFTLESELSGGAYRNRLDKSGSFSRVSVNWATDKSGYEYLMAFFRTATNFGSTSFTIDLILDDGLLQEYVAFFEDNSLGLQSQTGDRYVCAATLKVQPLPVDSVADQSIIDNYGT